MTVIEIFIALFLPFVAVLLRRGLCMEVLWAFLLQLLGHVPGVVYGLWVITKEPQVSR
jgi:uncharacterized membrane protein YqaE (UPF0057 family)